VVVGSLHLAIVAPQLVGSSLVVGSLHLAMHVHPSPRHNWRSGIGAKQGIEEEGMREAWRSLSLCPAAQLGCGSARAGARVGTRWCSRDG
jgi:hypothetical protein